MAYDDSKVPGLIRPSQMRLIPSILCLPLAIVAGIVGRFAIMFPLFWYNDFAGQYPKLVRILPPDLLPSELASLAVVCGICCVLLSCFSIVGLFRKRWTLAAVRKGFATVYALFIYYAGVVIAFTGKIEQEGLAEAGEYNMDSLGYAVGLFRLRKHYLWIPVCVVLFFMALHLVSWLRRTINIYTGADSTDPAPGDRILENLRVHGKDPPYRKSMLTSIMSHVMVIIVIPWLLEWYGCIEPYKAPWGGGNPAVQLVQMVKPKKKKKRKKYILRPDSAIIFKVPDLDDSKVMEQVDEQTHVRYVADASAAHGKLGDGDAATPGWQDGFKDGCVRFIRMEYSGEGWDDGMDAMSRADLNFLEKFRELSGGMKTANKTESHAIRLLKRYPKGMAPPFVYMTGDGRIGTRPSDRKILKEYLLGGGMLFADCGSSRWHGEFIRFIQSPELFPGQLKVIADDDPIFQIPFTFPNGAPPLWHHGGNDALGVKYKGRWVVFYHPGDINDAWKTGHSGLDPELAQGAYHMGVNIIYHAFINYLRETRKYRK